MLPVFDGIVSLDIQADDDLLEDYAVEVLVTGKTQLPYEETFRARFDDEPVEAIAIDIYGTGFTGYVKNKPPDGARLFVEFDGEDAIDTGLVFSSDNA